MTATLMNVQEIVNQLSPADRLKLAADICEQLSHAPFPPQTPDQERKQRADDYLAACEEVAQLWEGEFDSAADLRCLRDEE